MSFLTSSLSNLPSFLLLAVGFGFVVFWHELGHFLAAKWAGVKVEQFAVGFGQAMLAWRKGLGLRVGTTRHEYLGRVYKHLGKVYNPKGDGSDDATQRQVREASEALGLSETEYRLNWIPLGGYVKMLGQDDLKPNSDDDDPRAFNRQSIPKRMVIVSAGVIMNVILAALGFMILFTMGFNVQPARIGLVEPNSPADVAGLRTADEIDEFDGKRQYNDWTKLTLNVALAKSGEPTPVRVKRVVDGKQVSLDLTVIPRKGAMAGAGKDFVGLGITSFPQLKGLDPTRIKNLEESEKKAKDPAIALPEAWAILPGDVITHINGQPVGLNDYALLDAAAQSSGGKPIALTVKRRTGPVENVQVTPRFMIPFGEETLTFAGMTPRLKIEAIVEGSHAKDKLKPGDIILQVTTGQSNVLPLPTLPQLLQHVKSAEKVTVQVQRGNEQLTFPDIETVKVNGSQQGLGIKPALDLDHVIVAKAAEGTPAAAAGLPTGATLLKVGDRPVANWYEAYDAMKSMLPDAKSPAAASIQVTYADQSGVQATKQLQLSAEQAGALARYHLAANLELGETITPRIASGVGDAIKQGVVETRDFILQFYLTLRRMATADVSPKNLMGPLGIFQSGTAFAARGNDWLIWFLAMISANLAVVNFLPIPIVDGGLFTFLLIEKFKGRPVSPKTQAIAQYVGLALLLGVFLFVTYQDVMRLL